MLLRININIYVMCYDFYRVTMSSLQLTRWLSTLDYSRGTDNSIRCFAVARLDIFFFTSVGASRVLSTTYDGLFLQCMFIHTL